MKRVRCKVMPDWDRAGHMGWLYAVDLIHDRSWSLVQMDDDEYPSAVDSESLLIEERNWESLVVRDA